MRFLKIYNLLSNFNIETSSFNRPLAFLAAKWKASFYGPIGKARMNYGNFPPFSFLLKGKFVVEKWWDFEAYIKEKLLKNKISENFEFLLINSSEIQIFFKIFKIILVVPKWKKVLQ